MTTLHIILISLFTTGITATPYCDQQLKQLQVAANNLKQNVPSTILPYQLAVTLMLSTSLLNLLVYTKWTVGVEENGILLMSTVTLQQQMEDGQ